MWVGVIDYCLSDCFFFSNHAVRFGKLSSWLWKPWQLLSGRLWNGNPLRSTTLRTSPQITFFIVRCFLDMSPHTSSPTSFPLVSSDLYHAIQKILATFLLHDGGSILSSLLHQNHLAGRHFCPPGLFVIVSWMSFLIPMDEIGGRMGLLVILFLLLVNIFDTVATNTPKVGK